MCEEHLYLVEPVSRRNLCLPGYTRLAFTSTVVGKERNEYSRRLVSVIRGDILSKLSPSCAYLMEESLRTPSSLTQWYSKKVVGDIYFNTRMYVRRWCCCCCCLPDAFWSNHRSHRLPEEYPECKTTRAAVGQISIIHIGHTSWWRC